MANHSPAYGSGRTARLDPIAQIGPAFAPGCADPVAEKPSELLGVGEPLVRLLGVRLMRRGVPWKGVGLRLQHDDPASMLFEVFLTAGDGRDLIVAVLDEDDAIAVWRAAGKAMMLPLMMQAADGTVSNPYPQLGAVALGPFHFRRQHSFLRCRRPRFLARRQAGRAGLALLAVRPRSTAPSEAT